MVQNPQVAEKRLLHLAQLMPEESIAVILDYDLLDCDGDQIAEALAKTGKKIALVDLFRTDNEKIKEVFRQLGLTVPEDPITP